MPSRTLETILTGRNELSPVLATAARDVVAYEAAVEAANSRSAESASKSAERQRAAADQVVEANSKVKESAEEAARQVSDVRVELTALDGKTADVGVDVDTADARAQLDEVNTRLDEVAASKPTARVEAETTAAEERLRAVQAELDRIDGERVTATARVEAETAAAQAELRALQAELDRIDGERATAKVDVDTAGSYSGVSSLIGALGMVAPAIVPIGAAAIAAGASIGTMAAAGVAGAGIMAIAFGGVVKALKLLDQQESQQQAADYTAAQGASARAQAITSAQRQIASAQMALGDAQRQADEQRITSAEAIQNAVRGQAAAQMALGDTQRQAADAQIQASEQVVAAQYNLQQADQAEANAVKALTDARAAATRQLESYANQAVDAQLAEKQAVLDLQTAQDNQRKTAASGTATAQQRAQADLDLQKAQQRLTEAQQAATNASQDNTKAQKDGVDGAPQVVSAVKAVSDAQHGQRDAAQNLADAQRKQAEQTITSQEAIGKAQQAVAVASQGVADARRKAAQQEIASQESVQRAQQGVAAAMDAMKTATAASAGATSASLAQINDKIAKLDPATRSFAEYLRGTWKPIWEQVQHAAAAGMLPGVQDGLDALVPVMPNITHLVGSLASTMGDLFREGSQALAGPFWQHWLNDFARAAPGLLTDLVHTAEHVAHGFAGIIDAFLPMDKQISSGLVDLTQRFADWGEGLKQSKGFHEFVQYVHDTWPVIKDIIENVSTAIGHIIQAGGVLGGPTLQILRTFSGLLASLPVPVLVALVGAFEGLKILQTIDEPLQSVTKSLSKMGSNLAGKGGLLGSVGSGLTGIASAAGPAALGIGAVVTISALWIQAGQQATDVAVALGTALHEGGSQADAAAAYIQKFADITDLMNHSAGLSEVKLFGTSFRDLIPTVDGANRAYVDWFNSLSPGEQRTEAVKEAQQKLNDAIAQYGANSPEAQQAAADYQGALGRQKTVEDQVNTAMQTHLGLLQKIANQELAASNSALASQQAQLQLADASDRLNAGMADGTLKGNALKEAQLALGQQVVQTAEAAAKQAADQAKANGVSDTANVSNQALLASLQANAHYLTGDALAAVQQQIKILQAATVEQGNVSDAVNKNQLQVQTTYDANTVKVKSATDAQIKSLQDLGLNVTRLPDKTVIISADTSPARQQIAGLLTSLSGLPLAGGFIGVAGAVAQVLNTPPPAPRAAGSIDLRGASPMASDVATVVSPGTLRLIGDNPHSDEAFIPLNGSTRSHAILDQAASRMGRALLPMAAGGVLDQTFRTQADPIYLANVRAQQAAAAAAGYNGPAIGPPGAGVERWRPVVLQALDMMGQPAALANTTLRRMNQESGGNPTIVNRSDINWQRGTPSVGLMQVIGPTYRANRDPRHDVGPYSYGTSVDGLSNVLASMHYAIGRYGSLAAAYNKAGGYAGGGDTPAGGPFWVGERGPELLWSDRAHYVSTAEQSARLAGAGFGPVGYNAAGTGFTAAAAPGYSAVTGGSRPAATVAPSMSVQARVFIGTREITDIVRVEATAIVDGAFDELHDTVHYATGG